MRSSVDEVRERDQGGGEADSRAIERSDQDFWVGVEGIGDLEVVGNEGAQALAADISVGWEVTGDIDIGTAMRWSACTY